MKNFFILVLLLFSFCKEKNILRFSKGINPVFYNIDKDSIRKKGTTEILSDSKSCQTCHKTEYENWFNSRHKVAFTNELYTESHEREPRQWCVNCHAPLSDLSKETNPFQNRILKEEGISCNVCHVRNQKILISKLPILKKNQTEYSHDYEILPELSRSEFCASCHEFNFPTLAATKSDKNFQYSHLPMQETFSEFKKSYLSKFGECQTCHLRSNSSESHSFFGGHDASKLSTSIFINIERVSKNTIRVDLITQGIAHAFPTGDLFRTLRVQLRNAKNQKIVGEISLKKDYVDNKSATSLNDPAMNLVSDSRIPTSEKDINSQRSFTLQIPDTIQEIEALLFMDYLHGLNRILTKLPEKITELPFKTQRFKLKSIKESG
jgi:hypothetical protein